MWGIKTHIIVSLISTLSVMTQRITSLSIMYIMLRDVMLYVIMLSVEIRFTKISVFMPKVAALIVVASFYLFFIIIFFDMA